MPEYTAAVIAAVALTLAYEWWVVRSGVLRSRVFWLSMAVCFFFMVLTNGWLTKLSAPIVNYDADAKSPWRFPLDIPIEDFAFGFALLALVVIRWTAAGQRDTTAAAPTGDPVGEEAKVR